MEKSHWSCCPLSALDFAPIHQNPFRLACAPPHTYICMHFEIIHLPQSIQSIPATPVLLDKSFLPLILSLPLIIVCINNIQYLHPHFGWGKICFPWVQEDWGFIHRTWRPQDHCPGWFHQQSNVSLRKLLFSMSFVPWVRQVLEDKVCRR